MRRRLFILALAGLPTTVRGQTPLSTYADAVETRADGLTPDVRYDVRLDPSSGRVAVVMHVSRAPDTVRIALPRWAPGAYRLADFASRVRGLTVHTSQRERLVADSGLGPEDVWPARSLEPLRVPGGELDVRYEIVGDTAPNNRGFLRATGALLDGPATFVYLLGHTLAPARVRFETPAGWRIITGLEPTSDAHAFFAPSYDVLIDSPVMFGDGRSLFLRLIDVDGVPHRVAWWRRPASPAFDTAAFLAPLAPIIRQTRRVFGWLPYRDYTFLYVDGAGGGLEHLNSTTIGLRAADVARDPLSGVDVSAHEYFHHWNVKRIRPVVLGPFDYQHVTRTRSLWFSEGVTDYYAGVLLRRGDVITEADARDALASSLQSYLGNPASSWLSPERSSLSAWDSPAVNRGYSLSYYLSGALLGEVLDTELRARNPKSGGMDAVMRRLRDRYAGARGFADEDLRRIASEVCGCDMRQFFARYVAGGATLPVEKLAQRLGWSLVVERAEATDTSGRPLPDHRVSIISYGGLGSAGGAVGGPLKISVTDPTSAWGRAGLITGDTLVAIDEVEIHSPADFTSAVARLTIGDSTAIRYRRGGEPRSAVVRVGGYERVRVRLEPLPNSTPAQIRAREIWMRGDSTSVER
jgi:predicted metalloprotease with PDZ domain